MKPSSAVLRQIAPDNAVLNYRLGYQDTVIGRNESNDIVLADDKKASGQHARIEYNGVAYQIIDLDSMNGVFVNGQQITRRSLEFSR